MMESTTTCKLCYKIGPSSPRSFKKNKYFTITYISYEHKTFEYLIIVYNIGNIKVERWVS